MFTGGAVACLLGGALMILYAEVGKFRHRDRMLAMVTWTGAENVLDVGTGRGLLAIGAAGKLTTGRVVGIDIWNAADLTGNTADAFLANAEAEGVAERIEVRTADAAGCRFPTRRSTSCSRTSVSTTSRTRRAARRPAARSGGCCGPGAGPHLGLPRDVALRGGFSRSGFQRRKVRPRPLRYVSADADRHGAQAEELRRRPGPASPRRPWPPRRLAGPTSHESREPRDVTTAGPRGASTARRGPPSRARR